MLKLERYIAKVGLKFQNVHVSLSISFTESLKIILKKSHIDGYKAVRSLKHTLSFLYGTNDDFCSLKPGPAFFRI